jgi:hypothetical protein
MADVFTVRLSQVENILSQRTQQSTETETRTTTETGNISLNEVTAAASARLRSSEISGEASASGVTDLDSIDNVKYIAITKFPTEESAEEAQLDRINKGFIEFIRGMPMHAEIEKWTKAGDGMDKDIENFPVEYPGGYIPDIDHSIKLMNEIDGAKQKPNSVQELIDLFLDINNHLAFKKDGADLLPIKTASGVRNWIHVLKDTHPAITEYIVNKWKTNQIYNYWKEYSQKMGLNTVLHNADSSTIDVLSWGTPSILTTDIIKRNTEPWRSVSYISEDLRFKLSHAAVKTIQNGGNAAISGVPRNLPSAWIQTTAPVNGGIASQSRPIEYNTAHGVNLNNDWYHWFFRIKNEGWPEKGNKIYGLKDTLMRLNDYYNNGDFLIHVYVQYLQPILDNAYASSKLIAWGKPLGSEETFPRRNSELLLYSDSNTMKTLDNSTEVDDSIFEPI